jgi:hypothetical protein
MAITGPVIVQGENMAFGDIVRHRGGGERAKVLVSSIASTVFASTLVCRSTPPSAKPAS